MSQGASGAFDSDMFWNDVHKYMERHNLTFKELAALTNSDQRTVDDNGRRGRSPSLYLVCRLASLCDLDINKYVIHLEGL